MNPARLILLAILLAGLTQGAIGFASTASDSSTATATSAAAPVPAAIPSPPSFTRDILPILSKSGCNAGSCHAKADGQNGFKLSVFSYDPRSDYEEITRESRGRRVFPASPEHSLILLKATLAMPHEGGQRFLPGSPPHQTFIDWIRSGMVYSHPDEAPVSRLQLEPDAATSAKNARHPLRVMAIYADGLRRDVTDLADLRSTDNDLVTVDDQAVAHVGGMAGEAAVVARFMGHVAVTRLTVPPDRLLPEADYAGLPVNNFIDRIAYERFRELGLLPSAPCTDAEFFRRSTLDATGTLPTADETRAFLAETSPDKRARHIDRLLDQPAYADHWAVKWSDLIRPNPSRVGVKGIYLLDQWLRESFRRNQPYDAFAREILTAQGSTHRYGPAVVFRDRREPAELTTLVSQIFLGTRLECARCHNHPNEKWSQEDFYRLASYFAQIKRKGTGISPPISGSAEWFYHDPGGEVKHPVSGKVMSPKPPDDPEPALEPGRDPREALADWMTRPSNPFFARAIVNRVWAEFMGRGFVEPVDDFRASNPAAHEALLDALAREFVGSGFDLKHLMRTIMTSHLYQLSSDPNETNRTDTRNFSRAYRRRLPAEVLLDAACRVTGVPDNFQGLPRGSRAIETWNHQLDSLFMDAFGRPDSSAECPCERERASSVVQALHLMNSNELQSKIANPDGLASRLSNGTLSEPEIITELYLAAFNRFPEDAEVAAASKAFTAPDATRATATQDILWALLNSAEFVFNH